VRDPREVTPESRLCGAREPHGSGSHQHTSSTEALGVSSNSRSILNSCISGAQPLVFS
jgi:hypothetical protein